MKMSSFSSIASLAQSGAFFSLYTDYPPPILTITVIRSKNYCIYSTSTNRPSSMRVIEWLQHRETITRKLISILGRKHIPYTRKKLRTWPINAFSLFARYSFGPSLVPCPNNSSLSLSLSVQYHLFFSLSHRLTCTLNENSCCLNIVWTIVHRKRERIVQWTTFDEHRRWTTTRDTWYPIREMYKYFALRRITNRSNNND